eukprot:CAMPEP_0206009796 /NCGR_PEP_ID=MMETSP1464-20131121/10383_1 /ASSEMBLY_ACC=CAM_ASM_001124 /TAXON_ID=119497 /ORGANISM="Exanthemachrysis gayraliae, Strain RCC1523" /LENGTH=158 /DNA_ID=CAMNT_0053383401 /DNA_START=509 /DNA_END=982 /DNA_ORIENTATION=-
MRPGSRVDSHIALQHAFISRGRRGEKRVPIQYIWTTGEMCGVLAMLHTWSRVHGTNSLNASFSVRNRHSIHNEQSQATRQEIRDGVTPAVMVSLCKLYWGDFAYFNFTPPVVCLERIPRYAQLLAEAVTDRDGCDGTSATGPRVACHRQLGWTGIGGH